MARISMTKRMLCATLTLYVSSLIAGTAFAQGKSGKTLTILGSPSCQSWNSDKEKAQRTKEPFDRMVRLTNYAYILGFVSGINYSLHSGKDRLDAVNAQLIFDWVDKYCQENVDKTVYQGGAAFVVALGKITK